MSVGVWLFIRFQHRTLYLMHSPRLKSRMAGAFIRLAIIQPLLFFAMSLQGGKAFVDQMRMFIMFSIVGIGASVMAAGMMRRLGDEQFCTNCGYQCETSSDRCAECGAFWFKLGGLIRGRRVTQHGIMAAGAAFVLAGFFGNISPQYNFIRIGLLATPTTVRIHAVTTGSSWRREWQLQDLLAGKLSPEDQSLLAASLLDQRREEGQLSAPANTWLEKNALASNLSPDIRERFFDEMPGLSLEGPDKVTAKETFTPLIATRKRGPMLGATLAVHVYFAGVSTDGGKSFQGKCDRTLTPTGVTNVRYHKNRRRLSSSNRTIPNVSFDSPGEHELTVRMWLAVVPKVGSWIKITWRDDGTPILPLAAVWTKEINLRRTVKVE